MSILYIQVYLVCICVIYLTDAKLLARSKQADETLVIVTADHTHTLSINGYPKHGSNVFGVVSPKNGGTPYTTLTYATGGPDGFQVSARSEHE